MFKNNNKNNKAKMPSVNGLFPENKLSTLKLHPAGFYSQVCLSDDKFLLALKLYIHAKELPQHSEEQIRQLIAIANQYNFYFAIERLFIMFIEFYEKDKLSSQYSNLKELMYFYHLECNALVKDERHIFKDSASRLQNQNNNKSDLIEMAILFIQNLSTKGLDQGTPGYILASYGFHYLAQLIARLNRSESDNNIKNSYNLQIQDFFRLSTEMLIAAKLCKDDSTAEIKNAYHSNPPSFFENNEAIDKFINDYYQKYYLGKNLLSKDILTNNAKKLADIYLAKVNPNHITAEFDSLKRKCI